LLPPLQEPHPALGLRLFGLGPQRKILGAPLGFPLQVDIGSWSLKIMTGYRAENEV